MELNKGRTLVLGTKVKAYLNWNKQIGTSNSVFSIVDYKSGLVVAYAEKLTLQNAVFKVSQSGRNRVLEQRQKCVHAWVTGVLIAVDEERPANAGVRVYYNPYNVSEFMNCNTQKPAFHAPLVHLQDRMAWIPDEVKNVEQIQLFEVG